MLTVAALQIGHPVPLIVAVECDDPAIHAREGGGVSRSPRRVVGHGAASPVTMRSMSAAGAAKP